MASIGTPSDVELYHMLVPDGEEQNALTGDYAELISLIGVETTLLLFKHFRGSKIDCPKFLYRQNCVVEFSAQIEGKRERARIAIATGYTANRLEALVSQWRKR